MAQSKEEQPPPPACVLWFQVACTKRRLFPTRSQGGIRDDTHSAPRRGSLRAGAARAMARPGSAGAAAPPARQRCSGPTSWRPAAQREASPGATRAGPRGQASSAVGSDSSSLAGAAAADTMEGPGAALARGCGDREG